MSASQNSREITGFVQLAATAAPGHTLAELERVIVEEIGRLAADGPTEEEVARVALFLALDTSAGMTGQTMNVDCGSIMN